jgi:hypothetical protein
VLCKHPRLMFVIHLAELAEECAKYPALHDSVLPLPAYQQWPHAETRSQRQLRKRRLLSTERGGVPSWSPRNRASGGKQRERDCGTNYEELMALPQQPFGAIERNALVITPLQPGRT